MKKISILLIFIVVLVAGCGKQDAETTNADTGLMTVDAPNKLLTASDVDLSRPYNLAYNSEVVDDVDTYDNSMQLTITPDSATTLDIYGSSDPITDSSGLTPYVSVEVNAGETYILESSFMYYQVVSSDPTTAVVAVK